MVWKKFQNVVSTPIKHSDRNMGLMLRIDGYICLILNVYSVCDYRTTDSLIEIEYTTSIMAHLSNICSEESNDDMVFMGNFNCDLGRGKFFNKFSDLVVTY